MFLLFLGDGVMQMHHIAVIPLVTLAMMSESDQELIQSIYYQYRGLMYHVARKYFADKPEELKDAVNTALERMCRYSATIRGVPCNKMRVYVVSIVENVCKTRIGQIAREREMFAGPYDDEILTDSEGTTTNSMDTIFEYADAREWISSFKQLTQRDQDIIWMRHVDQMDYGEIAAALDMKEGAVRTALARAKKRFEACVRERGMQNED